MTDIMKMTEEEVRIEIAKVKGLTVLGDGNGYQTFWIPNLDSSILCQEDGLWTTDMNAAYELEGEVPEGERDKYLATLWMIVPGTREEWYLVHASPLDRCRAWLMYSRMTANGTNNYAPRATAQVASRFGDGYGR